MDIKVLELLKSKGITTQELLAADPTSEYAKALRVEELKETEEVTLYLASLETEQVKEYLSLVKPEKVKGSGHGGPKSPMPCPLCDKDSHRVTWAQAKINGVMTHVGTLSEKCEKYPDMKVRIEFGKTSEVTGLPLSGGQIAGRLKEETKLGWKSEDELSKSETSEPETNESTEPETI
jgi:hypothetical protein